MLGANSHGYQLWVAVGVLHGFDRVFRRKSPHDQGQLAVGCRLDGKPIDPQHVLRGMSAAAVNFHNELDVFIVPFFSLLRRTLKPLGLRQKDPQRVNGRDSNFSPEQSKRSQFSDRLTWFRRAERVRVRIRKGACSILMLGLCATIVKLPPSDSSG